MAKDFLKKEPSKTEKVLYELMMAQNSMEKGLWSTSSLVLVLAILTKQDPKAIAEMMVNGDEKLKEFSGKINEEIKKLEAEKRPAAQPAGADEHNHNHSHQEPAATPQA